MNRAPIVGDIVHIGMPAAIEYVAPEHRANMEMFREALNLEHPIEPWMAFVIGVVAKTEALGLGVTPDAGSFGESVLSTKPITPDLIESSSLLPSDFATWRASVPEEIEMAFGGPYRTPEAPPPPARTLFQRPYAFEGLATLRVLHPKRRSVRMAMTYVVLNDDFQCERVRYAPELEAGRWTWPRPR